MVLAAQELLPQELRGLQVEPQGEGLLVAVRLLSSVLRQCQLSRLPVLLVLRPGLAEVAAPVRYLLPEALALLPEQAAAVVGGLPERPDRLVHPLDQAMEFA